MRQQFFNVADAQREAEIEPHGPTDDLAGEAVALERWGWTKSPPLSPWAANWRGFIVRLSVLIDQHLLPATDQKVNLRPT